MLTIGFKTNDKTISVFQCRVDVMPANANAIQFNTMYANKMISSGVILPLPSFGSIVLRILVRFVVFLIQV